MLAIKKASPVVDEAFSKKCGGVAQPGLEHANANRQVGGSKPLPATNLFSWLPSAANAE